MFKLLCRPETPAYLLIIAHFIKKVNRFNAFLVIFRLFEP